MIKIVNFLCCKEIQTRFVNNETLPDNMLIGPLAEINLPFIPSMYSFSVSFGILSTDSKLEKFKVRYKFVDPDGKSVFDTNVLDLSIPLQSGAECNSVQCNLDIKNILLEKEGIYSSELYLNDKLGGKYELRVNKTNK